MDLLVLLDVHRCAPCPRGHDAQADEAVIGRAFFSDCQEYFPMTHASCITRARHRWMLLVGIGALVGTLDLLFAGMYWKLLHGVAPVSILQGIASGWLGTRAFGGGMATAWLGAASHFAIILAMTFAYAAAGRRAACLLRRPWLCGSLYGLLLYAVMNGIVVPLSAAARAPMIPSWVVSSIVVHMWLIGVPIAWAARRAARG